MLPVIQPIMAPIKTGEKTRKIINKLEVLPVESKAETKPMTKTNTNAPIKSSNAAIGINVFVTGPDAFISLTIDKDGAGAVANEIPPNTRAKYNGILE